MKKLYLIMILGWLCVLYGQAQPADLVLSSAESGTKLHQATNSITFAPGYSYTPNGGTLTAVIVQNLLPGDTRTNPIVAGEFGPDFQYTDTQNTTGFTNQYTGRTTNDVFYRFTLTREMTVTITHCGSALADTYMHLLDASGNLIVSNDDYSGEGKCSSSLHSYIQRELGAGVYYVVSEGYSANGELQTNIAGQATYEGTISGNIVFSPPVAPAVYTINTNLAVGKTPGGLSAGGSAGYTIPIDIPVGTNGLQPAVSLNYTSNYTDGMLGIGWNLAGIPAIARVNETIYHDGISDPVRGDLTDKYALDGNRLIVVGGTYGAPDSEYRTEIEEFAKVIAYGSTGHGPEWFKVYAKSGLIYEFGNTTDSKVKKSNGCILSWKVNKITDRYNNYITFNYLATDDEHPVGMIHYTGNSTLSKQPFAHILFNYKTRDDVSAYCYGGKEFTRDILLDNIEIKHEGQTFKKYVIDYMKDTHAQLQKVTESSSQGVAFNPTVFAWTKQTEQFTQTTHYSSTEDELYYVGDFNGDGRDDMVIIPYKTDRYLSSDKWKLYIGDANGNMEYINEGNLTSNFKSFWVGDFDGDGLMDLVMVETSRVESYSFYKSSGDNFTRLTSFDSYSDATITNVVDHDGDGKLELFFHDDSNAWRVYSYSGSLLASGSIPSFGQYYIEDNGMQTRILDFNGDGCSDLLVLFSGSYKVYEFKGANKTLIETFSGTNMKSSDFLLFGDFNGDGTIDIIRRLGATQGSSCYLMTLTESGFQSKVLNDFNNFDIYLWNNRMYARDMNGDGRTDVVLVGRGTNTGNSYNRINVAISSGNGFSITEHVSSTTMQNGYDRYFNFADYNGDGRYQLFYKYYSTSKLFSFANGTPSHLLSTVIDGLGAKSAISYQPMSGSSVYTRGSGAVYPVNDFSSAFQLVSQVSSDNGIGGTTSVSYQYAGAKVHRQGKGFMGFSEVTATNSVTGISTESHFEFDGTYYYPQLRYIYTKHGSITLSTTNNTWNTANFGDKRIFPYVSSSVQTDNLSGRSMSATATYDSYGNPETVTKDYGGGHTRTTGYQYNDERVNDWLIGRPTTITETTERDSETKTFTTVRSYFATSNLPDVDQYNTGDAAWWKLDRDYDSFGNLWKLHKETTGLSVQTTIYDYDTSTGARLLKVTEPAGYETGYGYYPVTGLLHTVTDPFDRVTTYTYNSADQLSNAAPSAGVITTLTSSLNASGGPANARYYIQKSANDGSLVKTWYDKLGRELRTETKNFGGAMVKVDKQYNAKGQLYQVSEPTTGTPSNWNIIGYDDYGRVTSQDPHFGATASFSYSGATTTRTVNGRSYTSTIDATGLTTQRTDPGGAISYAYRPDGALKSTTVNNVITSMTYDKNGNRLTITDPSAGLITNTYYGTGQPLTVSNNANEITTYYYQTNGLPDYYTTPEGTTDYSYNSDNLISNITSPGGVSRSYTYENGKVKTVTESIGGISNLLTFEYDSKGRLSRKYFNGTTEYEQYDYDTNSGYLYRIQFTAGGTTSTVWQLTVMDDYGHIRQATIGSASASWGYDGNNMLSQIAASGVQQYNYSFDVNTGNLNWRTNFLKNKTESFGYDSDKLDRLASVTGPEDLDISYTTNNNGNIYSKSDAGNYTLYDGYAVKEISDAQNIPETYQEIEYYSFEKVKKITEGDKTADFEYNADRQRIRMTLKTSGVTTKTRWYFGSSCEREDVGGTITNYIWIGGDAYTAIAVAKKTGTGSWTVYNIFRDHLGTITHLKNVSTGVVDEYSFDAWGRRRDKDDWTYTLTGEPALFADRGFTAHEYLADFNLYNMNGRMYDPVVGRFLSPDPFVGGGDYTQGFNRYSYALNNPLIYTDPNGENPLFFIIGAVIGAYVGGSASNGWQWNPGKWDYGDPGTYFGIIGGGLAGGLGAQWMFGPGGVLSGGTQVGINIGVSFDKIGVAFANFSFGEGAGLTFEGLGYVTIAGGGAYITANALNSWLNGNGTPPLSPEQKVNKAIAEAAGGGGSSQWAWALGATAVLAGDDVTGVGVVDDIAIPAVWASVGAVAAYEYMNKEGVQYSLRATTSGMYPVYSWGNVTPTGYEWLDTGDIWKIGQTTRYNAVTNTQWRYPDAQLRNWRIEFLPEFPGTRTEILMVEKMKIWNYIHTYGRLPYGNKVPW